MNNKVLTALMLLMMAACSAPQPPAKKTDSTVTNKPTPSPTATDWWHHHKDPPPKDTDSTVTPPTPLPTDTIWKTDTTIQPRNVYDTQYIWSLKRDTLQILSDTAFSIPTPKGIPVLTTYLPLNDYLTNVPGTPYPKLKDTTINVDQTKLTNVLSYGAKGDGKTNDDAAIKKAFAAARYGVLFPSGKTFIVSNTIKQTISSNLIVYAYGATIKKADLSGYGWLDVTGKGKQLLWLGGTIDGNQQHQQWFGNPTGGRYSGSMLGHNRLLGGISLDFFLVKDVHLTNSVMDGFNGESTTITVFANCTASNGANFHYNTETGSNGKRETGAGDQGTYFKGRITGDNQHVYILNCTSSEGSIPVQMSYPDPRNGTTTMPHNTAAFIGNSYFKNGAQDLLHFEDIYAVIIYNSTVSCDNDGKFYQPRIWVSNRTGLFYCDNTNFYNSVIHFGARAEMKFAAINGGTLTNNISYANTMISGAADYITNASIVGGSVQGYYIKDCYFRNNGKRAISGSKIVTGCIFDNSNTGSNTKGTFDLTRFNTYASVQDGKGNILGALSTFAPSLTISKIYKDTVYTKTDTTITTHTVYDTTYTFSYSILPTDSIPTDSTGDNTGDTTDLGGGGDPVDTLPIVKSIQTIGLLPFETAVSMKLPIARTRIVVSEGTSANGVRQIQRANNILCAPSIVWEKKAFPNDLGKYEENLTAIAKALPASKLAFVVIENEPNYNGGTVDTYLKMMQIAVKIFKPMGVEVYAGGFTYRALSEYCYSLYLKDGNDAVTKVMKAAGVTKANDVSVTFIEQYMQRKDDYGLEDNFNFHVNIRAENLVTLPFVVAKARQLTKGNLLVGECSFAEQKAEDVLAALAVLKPADKILLYSEPGGPSDIGVAVAFSDSMKSTLINFMKQAGLIK
jgi:hypothetical protein